MGPHVRCLSERARLFDELRTALRLAPPSVEKRAGKVRPLETVIAAGELRDIRKEVQTLASSLKARREPCAADSDARKAINVILKHIEVHGESLWGHEIDLPAEHGGGKRLVARTNNDLEGFFRDLKHNKRRRSGRKVLTQDLDHLPPDAALVRNLRHNDYVRMVCGSVDELPTVIESELCSAPLLRPSRPGPLPTKFFFDLTFEREPL